MINYEEGGEKCGLHGDKEREKRLSEIVGAAGYGTWELDDPHIIRISMKQPKISVHCLHSLRFVTYSPFWSQRVNDTVRSQFGGDFQIGVIPFGLSQIPILLLLVIMVSYH